MQQKKGIYNPTLLISANENSTHVDIIVYFGVVTDPITPFNPMVSFYMIFRAILRSGMDLECPEAATTLHFQGDGMLCSHLAANLHMNIDNKMY